MPKTTKILQKYLRKSMKVRKKYKKTEIKKIDNNVKKSQKKLKTTKLNFVLCSTEIFKFIIYQI